MKTFVNENSHFNEVISFLNSKGCNLFLVQAEYKRPELNNRSSGFQGIDIALELDPSEAPIILCSFMREEDFATSKKHSSKFLALMAKKRVGFLDVIRRPEDFYLKYIELVDSKKEENLLAIEINKIETYEKVMSVIQHSVSGRVDNLKDPRAISAISKARDCGIVGTDEEVFQAILDFRHSTGSQKFSGKYFPGIFCDLEGTLFINGSLNTKLLDKLKELSKVKPITLWTSGDIEVYQEKLFSNGIFWKLVSKLDFHGAEVEIAYDDLSYEQFQSNFGIIVRQFNRITGNDDEDLCSKLMFLHSLLVPSDNDAVLNNPRFEFILNMFIKSKKICEYVEEMKLQGENEYNQTLIIIRDFLIK